MKTKELNATPETEANEAVIPEESKGRRILNTVLNVVLVLAIILAAMCTYVSYVSSSGSGVPSLFGIRIFSIQTESMYPTLEPGDLIFDVPAVPSDLRKGDVITYWTVINGERVLNTHRIEEIYDGGGYLIFATKGDKNTTADALTVHESEIVGKYSEIRLPGMGKVFDYLQTSTGFLIVVVIPVFLFFLFHLVQFFRVLFEYQNVKNRIKYEQERGRTEDLIEEQKRRQAEEQAKARAAMEAELREKLRAELMATMAAQNAAAKPEKSPEELLREQLKAELMAEMAAKAEEKPEPAPQEAPAELPEEPAAEEPVAEKAAEEAPAAEEAVPGESAEEESAAGESTAEEAVPQEPVAEDAASEEAEPEESPEEKPEAPAED